MPPEKQKQQRIQDFFKEKSLSCSFFFEKDDKILEYIVSDVCANFNSKEDKSNSLSLKDTRFRVGGFDITIEDYSNKVPNLIEICFIAVTSSMSRLLEGSKSVDKFFKFLCKEIDAQYGCLDKEHEGYRLIWFEGEAYNLNLPHSSRGSTHEPFRTHGFIPVLKAIMNK